MPALEMSQHDLTIETVAMLDPGVLDHVVGDDLCDLAHEVAPAAWARLLVAHTR